MHEEMSQARSLAVQPSDVIVLLQRLASIGSKLLQGHVKGIRECPIASELQATGIQTSGGAVTGSRTQRFHVDRDAFDHPEVRLFPDRRRHRARLLKELVSCFVHPSG